MSGEHTPWRKIADTDAWGSEGYRIDSADVSLLAWVPKGAGAADYTKTADLIASAPALLEALEAICEALRDGDDFEAAQIAQHAGYTAIASAKGLAA